MIQLYGPVRIISKDEKLSVYRDGAVAYVGGKPIRAPGTTFDVAANVQPLSGYDLNLVPEGDRHTENLWLYTNEVMASIQVNDRINRGGVVYQVQTVETWGKPPRGYQKCRITRVDVGPQADSTANDQAAVG